MTLVISHPLDSETEAQQIVTQITGAALRVIDRQEEIITEYSPLPFTTATLLEDAVLAFRWTTHQVMIVAQTLFETGWITYPRTASVHVAEEAIEAGRQVVIAWFGIEALENGNTNNPMLLPTDETTGLEAHEAIRPTSPERNPNELHEAGTNSRQLYQLIWTRFLASLMKPARYRLTTVTLEPET